MSSIAKVAKKVGNVSENASKWRSAVKGLRKTGAVEKIPEATRTVEVAAGGAKGAKVSKRFKDMGAALVKKFPSTGTLFKTGFVLGAGGLVYSELKTDEEKAEFVCNTFCMPYGDSGDQVWGQHDPYRKNELESHGMAEAPICDPNKVDDCASYCKEGCDQSMVDQVKAGNIPIVGSVVGPVLDFFGSVFGGAGKWILWGIIGALVLSCIAGLVYKYIMQPSAPTYHPPPPPTYHPSYNNAVV